MRHVWKVAWFAILLAVSTRVSLASISVSVTPATVHVPAGRQLQFSATVSGTSNSVVIWSLSGINCTGNECGQISNGGLYSAPAKAPTSNVITVTATSLADLTASGSASVILGSTSDVTVSVSPSQAIVLEGQQQRFLAFVGGTTLTGVTWTLSGAGCGTYACGTVTQDGLYTAPAGVPSPPQVSITATSVADPSKSGSAVVTIAAPVALSISPAAAQVNAGLSRRFTATVTGATNTAVSWNVAGSGCTGTACGTISITGLYTAPPAVPSPAQVSVTATSVADPTKSAAASVTIIAPIAVTISPQAARVLTGGQQQFTATVRNTTNVAVSWSVIGSGCSGATCGSISAAGLYTAPPAVPSPAQVSVTATSVADPTKSSTASVTVAAPVVVKISPATAEVTISGNQQFTATVTGSTNTAVSWKVAGSGCSGATCGTISTSGLYTAPTAVPSPPQVSLTATSVADPGKSSTATVTIVAPVAISISPTTVQLLIGGHQQFTATVTGNTNTAVSWSVAGSGCSGAACGTISTSGLYTAPPAVPSPAQVSVTATSVADPTKSATAGVTILAPVTISVSPATVQVLAGAHQQFTATVTGTTNKVVTWSVSGSGCSGATCGTISGTGLYTAPSVPPNPPQITVTATSSADPSKSSTALVTITGPVSVTISPVAAEVVVGSTQQFSAVVKGTSNQSVSWSVAGSGCSGAACGTVSPTGTYFAPATVPTPGQVFVTVTSTVDSTKSSTATVTILPPIVVTLSPTTATVAVGNHQQFTATVTGNANTGVIWSVSGSGCSGTACGQVSSSGLYTAPATVPSPAQVTIRAASVVDPNLYRTATVTIVPLITVSVSPTSANVVVGMHELFTATVTGTTNQNVTWSVRGNGCAGVACGTISSTGLYTAPGTVPSPGNVTVTVTSVVDTGKVGSATVTILPPAGVRISPASTDVVISHQQQFTSIVTGTTNTTVSWSVTGAGCSGSACGTIGSNGLYTAPSAIPTPPQVTVKATLVADPTKTATATVTIIAPVVVTISPTRAVIQVNGQQQFRTTVIGSSDSAVDWSISGSGCTGSACGSITSAGLYTAPATVPSPATVIITASSLIDVTQSVSAIVTVVASTDSKLDGQYAFQFTGFDTSGVYQAAGSFTADGNGHITGGTEDIISTLGPVANIALTGTYQLNSDNRGVLTFLASTGTQAFRFALGQAGTSGSFIRFDASGIRGSGIFERQDSSSFNLSALKGAYVLSLAGRNNAGSRIGALSDLYFDGSGVIAGGSMDVNNGGTVLPTFGSIGGIYRVNSAGRGLMDLSIPGFGGGTFEFALYVVSANKLMLVSMDTLSSKNPIFSGVAQSQSGAPYLASALKGATVFSAAGESGNIPQVIAGTISFDGFAQPYVLFDENSGGTVTTGNVLTGAYSLGLNGAGTLDLDNSNGSTKVFKIYVIAPNHAYMMDASSSAVEMGELKPQSASPPFTSTDIQGPYRVGSGEPLVSGATLYSGVSEFDGNKAVNGVEDISLSSVLSVDQPLTGTYSITSSSSGRAVLTLTSPRVTTIAIWITSASEGIGFEIDSTNPQPVVLQFEQ